MSAGASSPVTIAAGVSSVDLTIPTATTAAGGLQLPAAVAGLSVTVRALNALAYTLWPQSGSLVNSAASMAVLAAEQIIECEAVTTTTWVCTAPDGYRRTGLTTEALTTATSTTVTVSAATDVVDLTVGTTSTVLTLPTPSLGKELTITQKATTTIAYTLTAATSTFINDAATTSSITVPASTAVIICRGLSATRWHCAPPHGRGLQVLVTASTTLLPSDTGNVYTSATTRTFTLPTCSSAKLEYSFFVQVDSVTLTPVGTDYIISTDTISDGTSSHSAAAAATALTVTADTAAAVAGTLGGSYATITCVTPGVWIAQTIQYTSGM
jgi:hypothetical protein